MNTLPETYIFRTFSKWMRLEYKILSFWESTLFSRGELCLLFILGEAFKPPIFQAIQKLPSPFLDLPTDWRLQMRPRNLNSFCDFGPDNHGQEARDFFFFGGGGFGRFQGVEQKTYFFRWRKWEIIGGMIRGWSWMIPRFDNKSKCVALIWKIQ